MNDKLVIKYESGGKNYSTEIQTDGIPYRVCMDLVHHLEGAVEDYKRVLNPAPPEGQEGA